MFVFGPEGLRVKGLLVWGVKDLLIWLAEGFSASVSRLQGSEIVS